MENQRQPTSGYRIFRKLARIPVQLWRYISGKIADWLRSANMTKGAEPLPITEETRQKLLRALSPSSSSPRTPKPPTAEERQVLARIRTETERLNRNNVLRTQAYWDMFAAHNELHWALLAHMVSRNGGWNMTDLRGDLLPRLLSPAASEHIFAFLERANALIFQDAYPQLMLYAESLRRGQSLFHLLPHVHVSSFMLPFWDDFWQTRNPIPLTVGLIVNEQHYIEGRVVQRSPYKEKVLDTLFFKAQSLLQLNQVVFPYAGKSGRNAPRLAGLILENFSDLDERIEVGKKLYALLFGVPEVLEGVLQAAGKQPHTGSRADYWPHVYTRTREDSPETAYVKKLDGCRLREGAGKLHSPSLAEAWPDRRVAPPERYDWFRDMSCFKHVASIDVPEAVEMTSEYCFGIHKLELAVLAGEQLPDHL